MKVEIYFKIKDSLYIVLMTQGFGKAFLYSIFIFFGIIFLNYIYLIASLNIPLIEIRNRSIFAKFYKRKVKFRQDYPGYWDFRDRGDFMISDYTTFWRGPMAYISSELYHSIRRGPNLNYKRFFHLVHVFLVYCFLFLVNVIITIAIGPFFIILIFLWLLTKKPLTNLNQPYIVHGPKRRKRKKPKYSLERDPVYRFFFFTLKMNYRRVVKRCRNLLIYFIGIIRLLMQGAFFLPYSTIWWCKRYSITYSYYSILILICDLKVILKGYFFLFFHLLYYYIQTFFQKGLLMFFDDFNGFLTEHRFNLLKKRINENLFILKNRYAEDLDFNKNYIQHLREEKVSPVVKDYFEQIDEFYFFKEFFLGLKYSFEIIWEILLHFRVLFEWFLIFFFYVFKKIVLFLRELVKIRIHFKNVVLRREDEQSVLIKIIERVFYARSFYIRRLLNEENFTDKISLAREEYNQLILDFDVNVECFYDNTSEINILKSDSRRTKMYSFLNIDKLKRLDKDFIKKFHLYYDFEMNLEYLGVQEGETMDNAFLAAKELKKRRKEMPTKNFSQYDQKYARENLKMAPLHSYLTSKNLKYDDNISYFWVIGSLVNLKETVTKRSRMREMFKGYFRYGFRMLTTPLKRRLEYPTSDMDSQRSISPSKIFSHKGASKAKVNKIIHKFFENQRFTNIFNWYQTPLRFIESLSVLSLIHRNFELSRVDLDHPDKIVDPGSEVGGDNPLQYLMHARYSKQFEFISLKDVIGSFLSFLRSGNKFFFYKFWISLFDFFAIAFNVFLYLIYWIFYIFPLYYSYYYFHLFFQWWLGYLFIYPSSYYWKAKAWFKIKYEKQIKFFEDVVLNYREHLKAIRALRKLWVGNSISFFFYLIKLLYYNYKQNINIYIRLEKKYLRYTLPIVYKHIYYIIVFFISFGLDFLAFLFSVFITYVSLVTIPPYIPGWRNEIFQREMARWRMRKVRKYQRKVFWDEVESWLWAALFFVMKVATGVLYFFYQDFETTSLILIDFLLVFSIIFGSQHPFLRTTRMVKVIYLCSWFYELLYASVIRPYLLNRVNIKKLNESIKFREELGEIRVEVPNLIKIYTNFNKECFKQELDKLFKLPISLLIKMSYTGFSLRSWYIRKSLKDRVDVVKFIYLDIILSRCWGDYDFRRSRILMDKSIKNPDKLILYSELKPSLDKDPMEPKNWPFLKNYAKLPITLFEFEKSVSEVNKEIDDSVKALKKTNTTLGSKTLTGIFKSWYFGEIDENNVIRYFIGTTFIFWKIRIRNFFERFLYGKNGNRYYYLRGLNLQKNNLFDINGERIYDGWSQYRKINRIYNLDLTKSLRERVKYDPNGVEEPRNIFPIGIISKVDLERRLRNFYQKGSLSPQVKQKLFNFYDEVKSEYGYSSKEDLFFNEILSTVSNRGIAEWLAAVSLYLVLEEAREEYNENQGFYISNSTLKDKDSNTIIKSSGENMVQTKDVVLDTNTDLTNAENEIHKSHKYVEETEEEVKQRLKQEFLALRKKSRKYVFSFEEKEMLEHFYNPNQVITKGLDYYDAFLYATIKKTYTYLSPSVISHLLRHSVEKYRVDFFPLVRLFGLTNQIFSKNVPLFDVIEYLSYNLRCLGYLFFKMSIWHIRHASRDRIGSKIFTFFLERYTTIYLNFFIIWSSRLYIAYFKPFFQYVYRKYILYYYFKVVNTNFILVKPLNYYPFQFYFEVLDTIKLNLLLKRDYYIFKNFTQRSGIMFTLGLFLEDKKIIEFQEMTHKERLPLIQKYLTSTANPTDQRIMKYVDLMGDFRFTRHKNVLMLEQWQVFNKLKFDELLKLSLSYWFPRSSLELDVNYSKLFLHHSFALLEKDKNELFKSLNKSLVLNSKEKQEYNILKDKYLVNYGDFLIPDDEWRLMKLLEGNRLELPEFGLNLEQVPDHLYSLKRNALAYDAIKKLGFPETDALSLALGLSSKRDFKLPRVKITNHKQHKLRDYALAFKNLYKKGWEPGQFNTQVLSQPEQPGLTHQQVLQNILRWKLEQTSLNSQRRYIKSNLVFEHSLSLNGKKTLNKLKHSLYSYKKIRIKSFNRLNNLYYLRKLLKFNKTKINSFLSEDSLVTTFKLQNKFKLSTLKRDKKIKLLNISYMRYYSLMMGASLYPDLTKTRGEVKAKRVLLNLKKKVRNGKYEFLSFDEIKQLKNKYSFYFKRYLSYQEQKDLMIVKRLIHLNQYRVLQNLYRFLENIQPFVQLSFYNVNYSNWDFGSTHFDLYSYKLCNRFRYIQYYYKFNYWVYKVIYPFLYLLSKTGSPIINYVCFPFLDRFENVVLQISPRITKTGSFFSEKIKSFFSWPKRFFKGIFEYGFEMWENDDVYPFYTDSPEDFIRTNLTTFSWIKPRRQNTVVSPGFEREKFVDNLLYYQEEEGYDLYDSTGYLLEPEEDRSELRDLIYSWFRYYIIDRLNYGYYKLGYYSTSKKTPFWTECIQVLRLKFYWDFVSYLTPYFIITYSIWTLIPLLTIWFFVIQGNILRFSFIQIGIELPNTISVATYLLCWIGIMYGVYALFHIFYDEWGHLFFINERRYNDGFNEFKIDGFFNPYNDGGSDSLMSGVGYLNSGEINDPYSSNPNLVLGFKRGRKILLKDFYTRVAEDMIYEEYKKLDKKNYKLRSTRSLFNESAFVRALTSLHIPLSQKVIDVITFEAIREMIRNWEDPFHENTPPTGMYYEFFTFPDVESWESYELEEEFPWIEDNYEDEVEDEMVITPDGEYAFAEVDFWDEEESVNYDTAMEEEEDDLEWESQEFDPVWEGENDLAQEDYVSDYYGIAMYKEELANFYRDDAKILTPSVRPNYILRRDFSFRRGHKLPNRDVLNRFVPISNSYIRRNPYNWVYEKHPIQGDNFLNWRNVYTFDRLPALGISFIFIILCYSGALESIWEFVPQLRSDTLAKVEMQYNRNYTNWWNKNNPLEKGYWYVAHRYRTGTLDPYCTTPLSIPFNLEWIPEISYEALAFGEQDTVSQRIRHFLSPFTPRNQNTIANYSWILDSLPEGLIKKKRTARTFVFNSSTSFFSQNLLRFGYRDPAIPVGHAKMMFSYVWLNKLRLVLGVPYRGSYVDVYLRYRPHLVFYYYAVNSHRPTDFLVRFRPRNVSTYKYPKESMFGYINYLDFWYIKFWIKMTEYYFKLQEFIINSRYSASKFLPESEDLIKTDNPYSVQLRSPVINLNQEGRFSDERNEPHVDDEEETEYPLSVYTRIWRVLQSTEMTGRDESRIVKTPILTWLLDEVWRGFYDLTLVGDHRPIYDPAFRYIGRFYTRNEIGKMLIATGYPQDQNTRLRNLRLDIYGENEDEDLAIEGSIYDSYLEAGIYTNIEDADKARWNKLKVDFVNFHYLIRLYDAFGYGWLSGEDGFIRDKFMFDRILEYDQSGLKESLGIKKVKLHFNKIRANPLVTRDTYKDIYLIDHDFFHRARAVNLYNYQRDHHWVPVSGYFRRVWVTVPWAYPERGTDFLGCATSKLKPGIIKGKSNPLKD